MSTRFQTATETMYQFLLSCFEVHDPYAFCGKVAEELYHLIPYAQARVIFLSTTGRIEGSLLYGVQKRIWDDFMYFYRNNSVGSLHSIQEPLHISAREKVKVCDWTSRERIDLSRDFYEEYVKPLRLTYCLGFGLADQENCIRCIISLDRKKLMPYTEDDLRLIRDIRPLLEDCFIDMMLPEPGPFSMEDFMNDQSALTKREKEIAELLCCGSRPKQVAERLGISVTTVYKHVDNIYKKLGISNRHELFARFRSMN